MKEYIQALESMKNRLIDAKFTIDGTTLYSKDRNLDEDYKLVKEALQRLESIENAKPSEALVCLDYLYCNPIGYINIDRNKDYNTIKQALLKTQKQEKVLKCILENIELDENYDEQGSGSTKAYKLIIPNCISVEEDDDYTDDCYPNSDFETIDSFIKEVVRK